MTDGSAATSSIRTTRLTESTRRDHGARWRSVQGGRDSSRFDKGLPAKAGCSRPARTKAALCKTVDSDAQCATLTPQSRSMFVETDYFDTASRQLRNPE